MPVFKLTAKLSEAVRYVRANSINEARIIAAIAWPAMQIAQARNIGNASPDIGEAGYNAWVKMLPAKPEVEMPKTKAQAEADNIASDKVRANVDQAFARLFG